MKFPLDIIWIDAGHRIVHIEKDVSPDTYPHVLYPSGKSLYVLEANAGFSEKNKFKVGNVLDFTVPAASKAVNNL